MRIWFVVSLLVLLTVPGLLGADSSDPHQVFAQSDSVWTSQQVYSIGQTVIVYFSPPVADYSAYPVWCYTQELIFAGPYGFTIDLRQYPPGTSSVVLGQADPGDVGIWKVTYFPFAFAKTSEQCILISFIVPETYFEIVGGPADLAVPSVRVSPRNPHQEDMVSFSAEIANVGGTDANGFKVEVYLDGYLWDARSASVRAGSSVTLTSDRQYQAEDGPHEVRWVVNSDHSVEESDYFNNEGSVSFFVSPRTVTLTEHATITKTKTQTEKHTLTITTMRTLTHTGTTDATVQRTVTANPVTSTQTLTGLVTSTVYSPTVTTTVTVSAQMIWNPLLWIMLGTLTMIGGVFQRPSARARRSYRRLADLFPLTKLFALVSRRQVRKVFFAICLVSVAVLSISSQTSQQAFASTVTVTRTVTLTEWTTLIQSLTSTRYITSTAPDTTTFTRISTGLVTITPTITATNDLRSLTTVYTPTTVTQTAVGGLTLRVMTDPEIPNLGEPYSVIVVVTNGASQSYSIRINAAERPVNDPAQKVGSGEYGITWTLSTKAVPESAAKVQTAKTGNTEYKFTFVNGWNWIEPLTTVDLWEKAFFKVLVMILKKVNPVFAVPEAVQKLKDIVTMYKQAELSVLAQRFSVQVDGHIETTGQGLPGTDREILVRVPHGKMTSLSLAFASAVGGLALIIGGLILSALGIILSGGLLGPALTFLVGAVSASFFAGSFAFYVAAMDPDPDYTVVPTPPEVKIPAEIEDLPEGSAKTFGISALRYSSYLNASSTALARYSEAAGNNEPKFMLMQLNAAKTFIEQANRELSKMVEFAAELQKDLPGIDANIIAEVQDYVRAKGMPSEMEKAMEEMGWKDLKDDLERMVADAPPMLFGFPSEAAISYTSDSLKVQVADIEQTIDKIEQQSEKPSAVSDLFSYLYLVVPAGVAILVVYVIMTRTRPKIIGVSQRVLPSRPARTEDKPRVIEIRQIEEPEKRR